MKPADVAASYDQIADRWDRLEQSDNGIPQHERAIALVDQRRYALDIGCGSSGRFVNLLIRHSFQVEGVDISEQMIASASQRHPGATFYRADICEWELPRQYDLISAWDSVWHVPLEDQRAVLKKIFTTPGLDVPSEKMDSAMGPDMYYSGLGIPETLQVRVPAHDGHDSGPMADTIPAAWRTVFRPDGGHFGGRSGTLSAMISERCPRPSARGR